MPNRTAARPAVLVPLAILIIAAALIVAVLARGGGEESDASGVARVSAPTQVQGPSTPDYSTAERRQEGDPLAIGPVDAPVVMVAFSDYQCPFCARWTEQTLPSMLDYVDAGELRIEWRDLTVFGEDSERAALAAHAAGQQGAFWEFHDALFVDGQVSSDLTEAALTGVAGELGLDVAQFTEGLSSPETARAVAENQQLGIDLGVYSTPVFFINGQPVVGAQPTEVFTGAVDTALAE